MTIDIATAEAAASMSIFGRNTGSAQQSDQQMSLVAAVGCLARQGSKSAFRRIVIHPVRDIIAHIIENFLHRFISAAALKAVGKRNDARVGRWTVAGRLHELPET